MPPPLSSPTPGASAAPDVKILLDMVAQRPRQKYYDMDLTIARDTVKQAAAMMDLPREASTISVDLTIPGDHGPVAARVYTPDEQATTVVLLYMHGGGWVLGNTDTYDSVCSYLAHRLKLRVVSLDYRLAPEHPFPAAHEDVLTAARWILTSPDVPGGRAGGLAVGGDSAGGNLAAVASASLRDTVKAQLLLYPVTDISRKTASYDGNGTGLILEAVDMDWFASAYCPDAAIRSDPKVSPLRAEDFTGLPPTMLLTCGLDPLRDEGRAYAARLVTAGVEVAFHEARGHVHGIAILRRALPSCVEVLDRCFDDFERMLARAAL